MLDSSRAAQLLQSNWKSATALAQTIYSIVTSKEPKTIEAPLTISVPEGKTALRIVQQGAPSTVPTPPQQAPRKIRTTEQERSFSLNKRQANPEEPKRQPQSFHTDSLSLTTSSPVEPVNLSAASLGIPSPALPVTQQAVKSIRLPSPETQLPTLASPLGIASPTQKPTRQQEDQPDQTTAPMVVSPAQVNPPRPAQVAAPVNPDTVNHSRYSSTETIRSFNHPYRAPLVAIEGPVSFQGKTPVQFDEPPRVFNPRTKTYDPIVDYDLETPTHIPRGRAVLQPRMGKIATGSYGTKWNVTIYPDGQPYSPGITQDDAPYKATNVIVPNAPADYTPNVGDWIGPIIVLYNQDGSDRNDLYYFLPGAITSYAKVQSGGITAASGTTLGSGNIILGTRSSATFSPGSGSAVTCYNAAGAVSASAIISVQWVAGAWSTSVAPC